MSIVSSKILRIISHQDSISVYEQHTDHLGKIHDHRYIAPVGVDQDVNLAAWAIQLVTILEDNEVNEVEAKVLSGVDPVLIDFDYITDEVGVRAMMRAFLIGEAIDVIHMLAWVQSFSTPDLNGLGFTSQERGQINAREGTIVGVKSLLETDQLFILDEF